MNEDDSKSGALYGPKKFKTFTKHGETFVSIPTPMGKDDPTFCGTPDNPVKINKENYKDVMNHFMNFLFRNAVPHNCAKNPKIVKLGIEGHLSIMDTIIILGSDDNERLWDIAHPVCRSMAHR